MFLVTAKKWFWQTLYVGNMLSTLGLGFETWIWDLDLGLGFGTWLWDLDLGLGFGIWIWDLGLGLNNKNIFVERTRHEMPHQRIVIFQGHIHLFA